MATAGSLVVNILARTQQFTAGLRAAQSQVSGFASQVAGSMSSAFSMLKGPAIAGGLAMVGAGTWGVSLAAQAEMAEAGFTSLLGSADAAKAMMKDIQSFASSTPFSTSGLTAASKTLLSFGMEQRNLLPTMRMLGDVAMGDEQKLSQLALVYGQIQSTGRLMGGDLLQLINAGFNPLQVMAKQTGKSMADLKKDMENGAISAGMVTQAFIAATSQGGQFYNATALGAGTLSGQFSTLKDNLSMSMQAIGQKLIDTFRFKEILASAVAFTSDLPQRFNAAFDAVVTTVQGATSAAIASIYAIAPGVETVVNYISQAFAQSPAAIAGSILNAVDQAKIYLLDLQIGFYELLPGSQSVMTNIGTLMTATWAGAWASGSAFFENLKALFRELMNIGEVVFNALKVGWNAVFAGKSPVEAMQLAYEEGMRTIAAQDQVDAPSIAGAFSEAFNSTIDAVQSELPNMPSLTESLLEQRRKLEEQIAGRSNALAQAPPVPAGPDGPKAPGTPTVPEDQNQKGTDPKKKAAGAARFGTEQVASSIFSAKYSDPTKKLEEYARKQVAATEDVKKAVEGLKEEGTIRLATLESD